MPIDGTGNRQPQNHRCTRKRCNPLIQLDLQRFFLFDELYRSSDLLYPLERLTLGSDTSYLTGDTAVTVVATAAAVVLGKAISTTINPITFLYNNILYHFLNYRLMAKQYQIFVYGHIVT
ncbi:hypothetical protein KQI38_08920 [Tissierella carlieri]|nr:hypothetical protein [Tissierella carlieri]